MESAFFILIPLLALTTLGVLATGIIAMIRGGEFNRRHGNRLMQMRVIFQAATIVLLGLSFLLFAGR